jgi:hypothetical protein
MGLFFTCYYAVVPALTALAGFSLDASGNPAAPLFLGGWLMFVAIVVLALFRRQQVQRPGLVESAETQEGPI